MVAIYTHMDKILRLISILLILQNPLTVLAKRVKAKDIKVERIKLIETGFRNTRKLEIELTNKSKSPARLTLDKDFAPFVSASQSTIYIPAKSTITKTIELSIDEEAYLQELRNETPDFMRRYDEADIFFISFKIQDTEQNVVFVHFETVSYFSVKRQCRNAGKKSVLCELNFGGAFAKNLNLSFLEKQYTADPNNPDNKLFKGYADATKKYKVKKLSETKLQYAYDHHSEYCVPGHFHGMFGDTLIRISNSRSQVYWDLQNTTDDYSLYCHSDEISNSDKEPHPVLYGLQLTAIYLTSPLWLPLLWYLGVWGSSPRARSFSPSFKW